MTLIFKGKRNETGDLGPVTPIELDSSSDSPRFRYVNDSEIYFTKGSGSWKAAATPFSTSSTAKPTATGNSAVRTVGSFADACVYGIGAVALLDLFG